MVTTTWEANDREADPICGRCIGFIRVVELTSAAQLNGLLLKIYRDGVEPRILNATDGPPIQDDHIDFRLACHHCGRRFRLYCDTQHGFSGRFSPVA